jgi:hypothetical protein
MFANQQHIFDRLNISLYAFQYLKSLREGGQKEEEAKIATAE